MERRKSGKYEERKEKVKCEQVGSELNKKLIKWRNNNERYF